MHVSFRGRPEVNFAVPSDSRGLVNRRCRPKGLRSVARISEMIHGDEHPIGELPCFPSVESNSSSYAASSAAPAAESSVWGMKPADAHLGEASELQAKGCNAPRYYGFPSCSNVSLALDIHPRSACQNLPP